MTLGKAYLVGAGPGRADLITVRGLHLLRQADVVLYDRLIARELLDEAPPHARLVFVGKGPHHHVMHQDEISVLLLAEVRAGRQVVRLKGGDPCVFGHGGEEALSLAAAGLPFEIVPGISSALAAPAYAGIPLTYRPHATAFAVVTGHEAPGKPLSPTDWSALARIATLVVLMAGKRVGHICAALLTAGRAADTPAALVSRATTCEQRAVYATLATLPDALSAHPLPTPAILVIGEVAALGETLAWFDPSTAEGHFIPFDEE